MKLQHPSRSLEVLWLAENPDYLPSTGWEHAVTWTVATRFFSRSPGRACGGGAGPLLCWEKEGFRGVCCAVVCAVAQFTPNRWTYKGCTCLYGSRVFCPGGCPARAALTLCPVPALWRVCPTLGQDSRGALRGVGDVSHQGAREIT